MQTWEAEGSEPQPNPPMNRFVVELYLIKFPYRAHAKLVYHQCLVSAPFLQFSICSLSPLPHVFTCVIRFHIQKMGFDKL